MNVHSIASTSPQQFFQTSAEYPWEFQSAQEQILAPLEIGKKSSVFRYMKEKLHHILQH